MRLYPLLPIINNGQESLFKLLCKTMHRTHLSSCYRFQYQMLYNQLKMTGKCFLDKVNVCFSSSCYFSKRLFSFYVYNKMKIL